jgi:hypothetical protein
MAVLSLPGLPPSAAAFDLARPQPAQTQSLNH